MSEERRLVTVLFADVMGSTGLGEDLDPEDLRSLLARYYAVARDVVEAHGGTLEKFIGDAVVAIFGLPRAHGDDAQRALSAAVELRDRLRADPALADQLPVRIGVNTGEVVASRDPAAGDFLVTGDAVNVAARLQQAADPWAIVAGERTARAAAGAFALGDVVEIEARGKSSPVRAVRVSGRAGSGPRARTPLVGRDDDLDQLELLARRAFRDRRPFLVSIIAPPGVGKTRLLEEFVDRLPDVAPGARVALAQCVPYGRRLTYWPLRAVLFSLTGLADDATPEAIVSGARSWLARAGVETAGEVAEALAATIGASEADVDRTTLFAAWRTALEAAAREAPLLVVFEDLHWSSDSLLELVEYVMQPRGDAPVLMIALTRPELLDRRPAWGGGRRNYVSLALEPLSDDAVTQLVGHLLEAPVPDLVDAVVKRAEGNPFYAGEIVRAVVERVPSLDDTRAVEQALSTLPDTVQATVLARIDLLEPGERRMLQLGSVFGRAFRSSGVAALEPNLAGDVETIADALLEKDLVRPYGMQTVAFRHIVIRDVAYGTLPRSERAVLHAAAGRWLEERAVGREETLAELIAYHYREAASLTGRLDGQTDAAREARAKAAHWLVRAADALAPSASVEAASHLRAAIELAEQDRQPALYERLGDVHLDGVTELEAYAKALALCREMRRPPTEELRLLGKILLVYTRTQGAVADRPSIEQVEAMRREGAELLRHSDDPYATATFLIGEAFLPFWDDAYAVPAEMDRAEASAKRALSMAEEVGDADLISAALDALGAIAGVRNSWEAVRVYARRRLALRDRLNLLERIDAHSMLTWAGSVLGELSDAEAASAAGLALVQPGQAPGWVLHLLAWRTYALELLGRWDDVTSSAERGRQLWLDMNRSAAGYSVRGFIPALDVARARHDRRGVETFSRVLEEIVGQFDPDWIRYGPVRAYVGEDLERVAAYVAENPDGPAETVERMLNLCTDRGVHPPAETLRTLVGAAERQRHAVLEGQGRRALGASTGDRAELTAAIGILERTEAAPYAARARAERALLTGADAELDAAIEVLEKLGDVDQIERIQRRAGVTSPS